MSGVAAVWTSHTIAPDILQSFLTSMPHRARDGAATWFDGEIGLGLAFTRRFLEEPKRAEVTADGEIIAVADIRLDNREEMLGLLSLPETNCDTLIGLQAYRKWGSDFARHLLGDFAIIILDQTAHRLIAARDHMGIKPLYWRFEDAGLALASELRPLMDLENPFAALTNRPLLQDQILRFVANDLPVGHTIHYPGLERLPAGHTLVYDGSAAPKVERYWRPEPNLVAPKDVSAGHLRGLLTEAVRCRMRGIKPVAAALSGGLDSSSLACLAAQISKDEGKLPLPTFSAVFDKTPTLNERPYIESALKNGYMAPQFLAFDDYAPLEEVSASIARQARLFSAPGLRMTSQICAAVREADFDAYLDGHGGDEVISHGFGRLGELGQAKDWRALWTELSGLANLYRRSRTWLFVKAYLKYSGIKGAYRLAKGLTALEQMWQGERSAPLAAGKTPPSSIPAPPDQGLTPELADHLSVLRSVNQTQSLEVLELAAALQGVTVLFPFFDKRVVEYCLSVPSSGKLDQGWIRLSLRQAMEGILPDAIRWRRDKFDFAPHLTRGVILHHRVFVEAILDDTNDLVGQYFDMSRVKKSFRKLIRKGRHASGSDLQIVWRAVVLSVWLKQQKGRTYAT